MVLVSVAGCLAGRLWICPVADSLKHEKPRVAPRRVEALAQVLGHAGGDVAREPVAVLGLGFVHEDDELVVESEELFCKGEGG